jgi:hypothetical protein
VTGVPVGIISGKRPAHLPGRAPRRRRGRRPAAHGRRGGGSVAWRSARPGPGAAQPAARRGAPLQLLAHDPPLPGVEALERHLDKPWAVRGRGARSKVVGMSGTLTALISMARPRAARTRATQRRRAEVAEIGGCRRGRHAAEGASSPGVDAKRLDQLGRGRVVDSVPPPGDTFGCATGAARGCCRAGQDAERRRATARQAGSARGPAGAGRGNARRRQVAPGVGPLTGPPSRSISPEARSCQYAALHDIGTPSAMPYRHTAYLIRNASFGFTTREVEIIAETARHHRKQIPKASTPELQALPPWARWNVRALAALLRIADALDRTHRGVLREASVVVSPGRLTIEIDAGGRNADLELWAAERRVDLLSRLVDRPVRLRVRAKARRARRGPEDHTFTRPHPYPAADRGGGLSSGNRPSCCCSSAGSSRRAIACTSRSGTPRCWCGGR